MPDTSVANNRTIDSLQVASWRRVSGGIFSDGKSFALVSFSVLSERRSSVG